VTDSKRLPVRIPAYYAMHRSRVYWRSLWIS
jgi:hypothetical protein